MLATEVHALQLVCTACAKTIATTTCPSHCPHCGKAAPDHGFPTIEAMKIACQNDRFRAGLLGGMDPTLRGQIVVTAAVRDMGFGFETDAYLAVARDTNFSPDNDPYHDHSFGTANIKGTTIFWKIDLYDNELTFGSPCPRNPLPRGQCAPPALSLSAPK